MENGIADIGQRPRIKRRSGTLRLAGVKYTPTIVGAHTIPINIITQIGDKYTVNIKANVEP